MILNGAFVPSTLLRFISATLAAKIN